MSWEHLVRITRENLKQIKMIFWIKIQTMMFSSMYRLMTDLSNRWDNKMPLKLPKLRQLKPRNQSLLDFMALKIWQMMTDLSNQWNLKMLLKLPKLRKMKSRSLNLLDFMTLKIGQNNFPKQKQTKRSPRQILSQKLKNSSFSYQLSVNK